MKTEIICILITLGICQAALPAVAKENFPADTVSTHQPSQGAALTVSASDEGALLHCAFQRMDAHATAAGLWMVSTVAVSHDERFRLAATSLMWTDKNVIPLCSTGTVQVANSVVRWERPDLTEEYSVSMDDVQQYFIIAHRLSGQGNCDWN